MSMNVLCFTGNLGSDAEQRFTPAGDSIVGFSVALSHGWGQKKGTAWMRCSMFGKRGESVLPYLKKGQQVGVSGEFAPREYEKDGQTRISLDVRVNDLTLLGKRQDSQESPPTRHQSAQAVSYETEDDIPF